MFFTHMLFTIWSKYVTKRFRIMYKGIRFADKLMLLTIPCTPVMKYLGDIRGNNKQTCLASMLKESTYLNLII